MGLGDDWAGHYSRNSSLISPMNNWLGGSSMEVG